MLQSDDNRPPLPDLGAVNQAVSLLPGVSGCICDVGWLADALPSGTEGARRASDLVAKAPPSGGACGMVMDGPAFCKGGEERTGAVEFSAVAR
jgi:hypothetical protein